MTPFNLCRMLQKVGVLIALQSLSVYAQVPPTDDVHMEVKISPQVEVNSSRMGLRTKPLRANVDLVLVPVTVTDLGNRPVLGLGKTDFRVFEGVQEMPIEYFFSEDSPLSIGLIVDLSSSMSNKVLVIRQAIDEFFANAHPEDDYFVITFSDRPTILADTTQSTATIQAKVAGMEAKGNTALADAIYLGLSKLRSAKYRRKALLVISDGGDNYSRYSLREVKRTAKEADVQIYGIDVSDGLAVLITKKLQERFGRAWLSQVTETTGGRTIEVENAENIPEAAAAISLELRNQYVIGYRPEGTKNDGKWRKLKVRLNRPENSLPLQVYYKTGYTPPKDSSGN